MKTQKLKMISIVLLTICLEGCTGTQIILPKIQNHERCSSFIEEISPNIYSGKCRCHEYQVSQEYIGRVGESYDRPLTYCSKQIQFSATTWAGEYLYFFDEIFFMRENSRTKARSNKYEFVEDIKESFK